MNLIICVIVGIAIGFLVVTVLKGQLKSVCSRDSAAGYICADSLNLQVRTDRFLYENTTRTPRPKSNNRK